MLVPVGATLADYIAAVKNDEPTHVRITFTGQNIVLTDEDIDSSGIRINDYLNGDTDLVFGKAVMKNISIPIIRSSKVASLIWSGEFKLEIGQEINGVTNWITYGYFVGSRPEKVNTVDIIDFTANDKMILFERLTKEWIDSLTFPKTIYQLFQSLCSYCGVGYESGDELPIATTKTYISFPYQREGQTCREILSQIAEVCGCYAKINSNGNCQMVWFANHTSDYTVDEQDEFDPIEIYDYSEGKTWAELESFTWEDLEQFRWSDLGGTKALFKIDSVNAIDTMRGNNIQYPLNATGTEYTIVDNPFITNSSEVAALYNRLQLFGGYIPMNINCIGNALIESGDIINVVISGTTFALPIFCKTTVWNGSLTDNYEVTGQLVRAEVSVASVKYISENTKYYNRQSGIDITPEGVDIRGDKFVKISSGGVFDVESDNFKIDSDNEIVEIGAWKFDNNGLSCLDTNYYTTGFRCGFSGFKDNKINEYSSGIYNMANTAIGNDNQHRTSSVIFYSKSFDKDTKVFYKTGQVKFLYYGGGYSDGFALIPHRTSQYDITKYYLGVGSNEFEATYTKGLFCSDGNLLIGESPTGLSMTYGAAGSGKALYPNNNYHDIGTSDHKWKYAYIDTVNYSSLVQTSSKEIKHNIHDLPSMGDKIDSLRPVTFIYDNDAKENKRMGLIYEEVIETMPDICTQDESNKAINYVELIPALIKEIQELRARVKQLEERE